MASLEKQFYQREVTVSGRWKLLQWKFTSCRYNIENSNGFNTFSMSEGLSPEDKEELKCAVGYDQPGHLPYQPTPEEIRELFPVVFSSFPLKSGKKAVIRTVYVGKDYAGHRWGNFFSHALVLPNGSWPFYPIQLWNSSLFRDGLSEEELRLTSTPDLLKPIVVSEDDLHDFSREIPSFLSERPTHPEILIRMINAVRDGRNSGKPILLRDAPENIPRWIASVQYAFPLRLACQMTFTTYAKTQPITQKYDFVGTSLEGNDFQFDSTSLNATNSVFDNPRNKVAEVSPRATIFTDTIKPDESPYPGSDLQEIQRFMDGIDCRLADESLDKAVCLYKFLQWNIIPKDQNILKTILDFHGQQPLSIRQNQTRQIFAKNYLYNTETLSYLLPILIKTTMESKDQKDFKASFLAFCRKQFEIDVRDLNVEYCEERFALLEKLVEQYRNDIANPLFSGVQRLVGQIQEPQKLAFLYFSLLLCLHSRDTVNFIDNAVLFPVLNNEEIKFFYDAVLNLAVPKAFSAPIHKYLIKQYTSRFGFDDSFATRYLNLMQQRNQGDNHRRYGIDRLKYGKPAERQGMAFLDYIINHTSTDEWTVWIDFPNSFRTYHTTITRMKFDRNRFWTLFDIEENVLSKTASRLDKKKKWEKITNIRAALEPITPVDRKYKLGMLGFPTWWDIWKGTIVSLFCLTILLLIVGATVLLYFLGVFEKTDRPVPVPSKPSVSTSGQ